MLFLLTLNSFKYKDELKTETLAGFAYGLMPFFGKRIQNDEEFEKFLEDKETFKVLMFNDKDHIP